MKKEQYTWIHWLLAFLLLGAFVSCETTYRDVYLYDHGTINATADKYEVEDGEIVTFADSSTKVYLRDWYFEEGTPSTSSDKSVEVTYKYGGTYMAQLVVQYVDNQVDTMRIYIEVDGPVYTPNPQPEFSESFGLYTEYDKVSVGSYLYTEFNSGFSMETVKANTYEGEEAYHLKHDGAATWAMASMKPNDGASNVVLDISYYLDGYYNIALRSTSPSNLLLRLQGGGEKAIINLDADAESYGFARDGEWHLLAIPIQDFVDANPAVDLTKITDLMVFRSDDEDGIDLTDYDFYIDNIFLSK